MALTAEYSIKLLHPATGAELLTVSEFDTLDYAVRPNYPGAFALTLSRDAIVRTELTRLLAGSPVGLLMALTRPTTIARTLRREPVTAASLHSFLDARLVVWRRPVGGVRKIDFAGCIRKFGLTLRGDRIDLTLTGADYNEQLDRRVIPFAVSDGDDSAKCDGEADDAMKAVVRENLGTLATDSDRDISDYMSVQIDLSNGTSITKEFEYSNLLTVLQEMAEESRETPATGVWFGMVPLGKGHEFEFRTRVKCWGQDRRSGVSERPVVFSLGNNNMDDPSYTEDYSTEVNVVYGVGDDDTPTETEDTARSAASPLNRCEAIHNVGNYDEDQADEITSEIDGVLEAGRPVTRLTFTPRDTETLVLGRDYDVGDLVTADFLGVRREMHFAAKSVRIDGGGETITAVMEEYSE